jgi:flagellin
MSLGVLDNISAIYAQNYLNQTQASLQTVLQQLSSGSRINTGADDAAGLAVVDGLQANESALNQSSQNATNGIGLLQTADGALAQVTNLLNRAVTLSTEAANGTLNSSQVSSANQEYTNILTEIGNIGATTNFNGNSVFTTTPESLFVSDGTGSGANTFSDAVGALTTASVGVSVPSGSISSSVLTNPTPTASTAITQAVATITPVVSGESYTGGSIGITLGTGTTYTFTATGTATQLAADFNADTQFTAQGLSATGNNTTGVITIDGPTNGKGGSISFSNDTLTETTSSDTPVAASVTSAVSGQSTATFTLSASTSTFSGTLSVAVGSGTAHSITVAPGSTGAALANQINSDTTFQGLGISAAFSGSSLVISGPAGAAGSSTLAVTGTTLTQTSTLTPGTGINFTTSSLDTLNATTAQAVLVAVTNAIAEVAYQRGIVGANINELTAASNVASSEAVNLTAASSSIASTNYGQATSDLSKYEVLSQTGISALAQANTVQQEILKLLQ